MSRSIACLSAPALLCAVCVLPPASAHGVAVGEGAAVVADTVAVAVATGVLLFDAQPARNTTTESTATRAFTQPSPAPARAPRARRLPTTRSARASRTADQRLLPRAFASQ